MAIGEFQPIDLLGMQGGLGNLPTAANVQALGNQQAAAAAGIEGLQARAMAERAQAQAAQQEQIDAQRFQTDLATFGDGSPKSIVTMMQRNPKYAKLLSDAHALEKADIQEADTLSMNSIYARAANGDFAGAAAQARRRLEAEKAAGNDTSDEQAMVDQLESGDPALQQRAMRVIGVDLAGRVGLDKFASVYGGVTTADGNVVNRGTGDVTYQGKPTARTPIKMDGGTDGFGNKLPDYLVDPETYQRIEVGGASGGAAPVAGGAPNLAPVVDAIIAAEGTAKNPNSSAVGVGQFVDGTWIEQFKARYPNTTLSVPEILKLKTNPKLARDLTAQYVEANTAKLGAAGVATDAPSVYLAHFLGPQDAIDVLRANPSTPVADIVAPESIAANKSVLAGKTAGEVRQWAAGKMGGAGGGPRVVYQAPSSSTRPAPPSGYQWNADGTQSPVKGGPADPTVSRAGGLKQLPANEIEKLSSEAENIAQMSDLVSSFKPAFSGLGSRGGNMLAAIGFGDETQNAQHDWWQSMEAVDNVVRNQLFGASLTAGEQMAWERTTVTPNMSPERINANLNRREAILKRALDRKVKVLGAAGYKADIGSALNSGAPVTPAASGWSIRQKGSQ